MKIRSIGFNNRKRAFEVASWKEKLIFPYSKADPAPASANPVVEAWIDEELGKEGFSYKLKSGDEGTILMDQILEYNQDPGYMRDLILYKLTIEVQKRIEHSKLSKREIIRRLGTSPAQFYRLLDAANYRKSMDKLLLLLHILDCDVDLIVRTKSA